MSKSVNLVSKQNDENDRSELLKKLRRISFILLFIVAFSSLILFLLSYRFSAAYVRTQEDKLIKRMAPFEEISSKVFLLNSRLTDISQLLSERKRHNTVSEEIIKVKPTNLTFSSYQIDGTGARISAASNNLLDINEFLNALLALTENNVISGVILNGITANASGYEVEILLN